MGDGWVLALVQLEFRLRLLASVGIFPNCCGLALSRCPFIPDLRYLMRERLGDYVFVPEPGPSIVAKWVAKILFPSADPKPGLTTEPQPSEVTEEDR